MNGIRSLNGWQCAGIVLLLCGTPLVDPGSSGGRQVVQVLEERVRVAVPADFSVSVVDASPLSGALGDDPTLAVAACEPAAADEPNPPPAARRPSSDDGDFELSRLALIDHLVVSAMEAQKMPGCVVCFGRRDRIAYLQAFGQRQVQPEPQPMTVDTVFDLASLTKPIATATAIMTLVETGQLRLGQRAAEILPEFGLHGKEAITIEQLLVHQSGLIPDNPMADYLQGPVEAWRRICQLQLHGPIGSEFRYSDVNFIVLGQIVERITDRTLQDYCHEVLFQPLGMQETGFLPAEELRERAAPTEQRAGQWIQGQVHDPRAFELGGVAGHAGLFSTAHDLAVYAQALLRAAQPKGGPPTPKILSTASVQRMARGYPVSSGVRGLGWDKQTGFSANKGDLLSAAAFGHGGFTGTVLWIDPDLDLFFIFLSNRVHPDGQGSVNGLAGQIANVIAGSLRDPGPAGLSRITNNATPAVRTGLDVLLADQRTLLADKRVGLITNPTGRDAAGRPTSQVLFDHPQINLVALFSPEHGIAANLDTGVIPDGIDPQTGLKIYSLYGQTRRPTPEMLAEVDLLVFDIQDIGTRFYTYISTMGEAMKAAAEHGKSFVVLDRPNPLGGHVIEGPLLDQDSLSFVGYHHLPVRHGMTVGELALMMRDEWQLDLDLQVVACQNWERANYWDGTGLIWVNPSPNMRSLNQAVLYPGMGLWEMTNLSVGRGTETPFEVLGAPWIDAQALAAELNHAGLEGVRFVPVEFTPMTSKYAGQLCRGVNVIVTHRDAFRSVACGLAIAQILNRRYPGQWEVQELNRLLGNRSLAEAIGQGADLPTLRQLSAQGLEDFLQRRQRFLLY